MKPALSKRQRGALEFLGRFDKPISVNEMPHMLTGDKTLKLLAARGLICVMVSITEKGMKK